MKSLCLSICFVLLGYLNFELQAKSCFPEKQDMLICGLTTEEILCLPFVQDALNGYWCTLSPSGSFCNTIVEVDTWYDYITISMSCSQGNVGTEFGHMTFDCNGNFLYGCEGQQFQIECTGDENLPSGATSTIHSCVLGDIDCSGVGSGDIVDCNDFDNYNLGNISTQSSGEITRLNSSAGDGFVTNDRSVSGTKSIFIGNQTNIDLNIDQSVSESQVARIDFNLFIPSNNTGAWGLETNNTSSYALRMEYRQNAFDVYTASTFITSVPVKTNDWTFVALIIQPFENEIELWFNHQKVARITRYESNLIEDLNMSFLQGSNSNGIYIDDLCYKEWSRDLICTTEYDPVTVDGIEYSNPCIARIDGYEETEFEELQSSCVCTDVIDPDIFCTTEYDPVCGCNGETYSNACIAVYGHGITSYTSGPCNNTSQNIIQATCDDFTDVTFGEVFEDCECVGYLDDCICTDLIGSRSTIPQVFNPVCGCNGVTYNNEYIAENKGVISYTLGACEDCYNNPLSLPWLVNAIQKIADNECGSVAGNFKLQKGFYNNEPVFQILNDGVFDGGRSTVFRCNGSVVQSSYATILGGFCLYDDLDLSNINWVQVIDICNSTIPTLDLNYVACDDGDPNTMNDRYNEDCNCVGEGSTPSCTQLTYPTSNSQGIARNITLTWNKVSGATGYRLEVKHGNTTIENRFLGDTNNFIISDLPASSRICVTVTPYNVSGQASNCSSICFTTESGTAPPMCTSLTQPIQNATDVPTSTVVNWTQISTATGYRLKVQYDNVIFLERDVQNTTTYQLQDLPEDKWICVTVTPYNSAGPASSCSQICFKTRKNISIPDCSIVTSPSNGAINISSDVDIYWNPVAEADGYNLKVRNGNNILDDINVNSNITALGLLDLPEGSEICIQVIPYNVVGRASDCTETCFTTKNFFAPPACTQITSPLNNAIDVPTTVNIIWDQVAEANGYRISVEDLNGNEYSPQSASSSTNVIVTNLPYNTFICAEVIPYNDEGDASGCPSICFTTSTVSNVNDETAEMIYIRPTITAAFIEIVLSSNMPANGSFSIYSMNGIKIIDGDVLNKRQSIDVTTLTEGVYLLNYVGKYTSKTIKFVKI